MCQDVLYEFRPDGNWVYGQLVKMLADAVFFFSRLDLNIVFV